MVRFFREMANSSEQTAMQVSCGCQVRSFGYWSRDGEGWCAAAGLDACAACAGGSGALHAPVAAASLNAREEFAQYVVRSGSSAGPPQIARRDGLTCRARCATGVRTTTTARLVPMRGAVPSLSAAGAVTPTARRGRCRWPVVADRTVLAAVNKGVMRPGDFTTTPSGCMLRPAARRRFIELYEHRLDRLVTHPLFGYRVSHRRLFDIDARLLARTLHGEIAEFPAYRLR